MRPAQRLVDVGLGFAGIAAFLVMWQIIGQYRLVGLTWPTLTSVLGTLFDPEVVKVFLSIPERIWLELRNEIEGQNSHRRHGVKAGRG